MPRLFAVAFPALAVSVLALAAHSAQAQSLDLYSNATASLSAAGTTASGSYTFLDSQFNNAPLDPTRTSYSDIYLLGSGSSAAISGGNVTGLHTGDNNSAVISGGTVTSVFVLPAQSSSLVTISGGNVQYLETQGSGVINILGTNLALSSAITPINGAPYYAITGTLQNGTSPFAADYAVSNAAGTLEFNGVTASPAAVPEASSVVSFGLLMLGGLALAACRGRASRAAR